MGRRERARCKQGRSKLGRPGAGLALQDNIAERPSGFPAGAFQ